jgi:hypothetical protein
MTKDEISYWLELGKLIVGISTPIAVTILGVMLLRRIENVKAGVARQSAFDTKWAEQFFECCQKFMQAIERDLTLLTALASLENPNDEVGAELIKEISGLHSNMSELQLRIRRSVVFAPMAGASVTSAAGECVVLVSNLVSSQGGNLDQIISKINAFNEASRKAHAEMLGVSI